MEIVAAILGIALLLTVLWDGFESLVLPRRVTRKWRLARVFYRSTWKTWSAIARRMSPGKFRQGYLGVFGPLSMLVLMVVWAAGLILGFALLFWSLAATGAFATDLYMSGTTFITLGLGDVTPKTAPARVITVLEAGTGFGFLALVIGYLPVLYQAFARRERSISLLDARAGSPSSAGEMLRRHAQGKAIEALYDFLRDWERWSADLLESHVSYPVLSYYRSQHDNQSWLAALTTILDTCALVITGIEGLAAFQAQLTFAIARHAVVDLAQILHSPPRAPSPDRLPANEFARLKTLLANAGLVLQGDMDHLAELRAMYEPYVNPLAQYLALELPPWMRVAHTVDNWRTSAWGRISTHSPVLPISEAPDEHMP